MPQIQGLTNLTCTKLSFICLFFYDSPPDMLAVCERYAQLRACLTACYGAAQNSLSSRSLTSLTLVIPYASNSKDQDQSHGPHPGRRSHHQKKKLALSSSNEHIFKIYFLNLILILNMYFVAKLYLPFNCGLDPEFLY